jgi:hypothetical protein
LSNAEANAAHELEGASALLKWFGEWPSFHDAEVLSVVLDRRGNSCVRIRTWETTKEIDSNGFLRMTKHVVVSFFLDDLNDVELAGFSSQNVISGLSVTRSNEGLQLVLYPCYGVAGTFTCGAIRVEIEPGKPTDIRQQ